MGSKQWVSGTTLNYPVYELEVQNNVCLEMFMGWLQFLDLTRWPGLRSKQDALPASTVTWYQNKRLPGWPNWWCSGTSSNTVCEDKRLYRPEPWIIPNNTNEEGWQRRCDSICIRLQDGRPISTWQMLERKRPKIRIKSLNGTIEWMGPYVEHPFYLNILVSM